MRGGCCCWWRVDFEGGLGLEQVGLVVLVVICGLVVFGGFVEGCLGSELRATVERSEGSVLFCGGAMLLADDTSVVEVLLMP